MHDADAGAHEGAAQQQTRHGNGGTRDEVERHRAAEDGRQRRGAGDERVVADRDRQPIGQHGDEVHRPYAEAHGEAAAGHPHETHARRAELGDARGQAQERVAGERGDEIRRDDESRVVRCRQRLRRIDADGEIFGQVHGVTRSAAEPLRFVAESDRSASSRSVLPTCA